MESTVGPVHPSPSKKLKLDTVVSKSYTENKLDNVSESESDTGKFNDTDSDDCDDHCCDSKDDRDEGVVSTWNDSDDEIDSGEWREYQKQVHLSGGFDLDFDMLNPGISCISRIKLEQVFNSTSDPTKTVQTRLGEGCVDAIRKYNKKNQTSLEFIRVEKANCRPVAGFIFLVTFLVKDKYIYAINKDPRSFRAKLYYFLDDKLKILSCRPKQQKKESCPSYPSSKDKN